MSHEIITLEPAKAGETLLLMQNALGNFNDTLYTIGLELQNTSASTYSEPLLKALDLSTRDLNEMGHAVNAGIYAFSHAFVHVIEQWKKTDARMASAVSFDKPQFEELRVFHHAPRLLHVQIPEMKKVIETISFNNIFLKTYFESMDTLMKDSVHYWRGASADQTRQNWKRHLDPLMDKTEKTINKVVNIMTDELNDFIKRDANNFPGKW